MSQTETTGPNQYGFYAVPKALEPKKKYRENIDDEYSEDGAEEEENPYATIEDKQLVDQKLLDRDYYVDEAPYPEFKKRQRGLDYGVQIEQGDLFDFDLEVRPLIQIIVGRSVVLALNELQEEKEKDERKSNLDKYQKKRNAELMVSQRLEAKYKRKQEESQRRKLQRQIYIKNQKQMAKKILSRKNGKSCLLGLKNEIYGELEDAGYLKAQPVRDLKVNYQEWLYQQIMASLKFSSNSLQCAQNMIKEEEKALAAEHQKYIEAEQERRKNILDERQRIRKQNQGRKEKKRIKKMRTKLNAQRQPQFIKFQQLMERYQQVSQILKFNDRSNGFSRNTSSRPSVYISGGLDNFIIALIQNSGKSLSVEQIQVLLIKVLRESSRELQFSFSGPHHEKINEVKKRMEQNKKDFMRNKNQIIKQLVQEISLDLSLLEAVNITIKSATHNYFLEALLNIHLTTQVEHSQEDPFQLNDSDKKRLQICEKIILNRQELSLINRLQNVENILRIHFQIPIDQNEQQKSQLKYKSEDEWIDIYDGQGWQRSLKENHREINRQDQLSASYALSPFDNSFVYDERTLHYLQEQLQKLLDLQGGDKMKKYREDLGNIRSRVKKDIPVFDGEIRWG